jgi:amino acid adenylation domain-containing protein
MMICTIPCRIRIDRKVDLQRWLQDIQSQQGKCIPYSHIGISDIQKWIGLSGDAKLFNSLFVFENMPLLEEQHTSVQEQFQMIEKQDTLHRFNEFDFELILYPTQENLEMNLCFDGVNIDHDFATKVLKYYDHCLTSLVKQLQVSEKSSVTLQTLMTLPLTEQEELLELGRGKKVDVPFDCAHHPFEKMAHVSPERIAVEHGNESISYGELNLKADRVAAALQKHGIVVGDLVPIITERSIDMVIAMLGILKAGAAFVIVDQDLPQSRIQSVLSKCPNGIGIGKFSNGSNFTMIDVHECVESLLEFPELSSSSPAYAVFTSGSTGEPKGVVSSHLSLCNLIHSQSGFLNVKAKERIGQFCSINFDVCIGEMLVTLSHGATLVLRGNDLLKSVAYVHKLMITPTMLSKIPLDACPKLEWVVVAGEAVSSAVVNDWGDRVELVNGYGPSEATIFSSFGQLVKKRSFLTVGKPLQNTLQYIVDSELNLVPKGVIGELLIGGIGVALGYLNQPALTEQKFIPNHFEKDGSKLYRTGDLCRWTENGEIEVIGRMDDQVKLKGYRIELDEVAIGVSAHPAVSGCTVLVRDDLLVAYVTPEDVHIDSLRDFVSESLPPYMLPSVYVKLKEFPMNTNGKVIEK